jgi:CheY-like chemotaxis protein
MTTTDTILLVEDNDDDVFFLQHAWTAAGVPNPLRVVRDGQQALAYLDGTGEYADRAKYPTPSLLLLDLKLPFLNGHEVLSWLRAHPVHRKILAVFLTSSKESTDVRKAYELGANGYLAKPASAGQLTEMVKALRAYWLELNVS